MAPTFEQKQAQVHRLGEVLTPRAETCRVLDGYYDGDHPLPPLVKSTGLTTAYRTLMAMAKSDWPKLIVDSTEERLEVQGVRFGDSGTDDQAWAIWQDNGLDAEQSMLHQQVLTDGRAFAIVWGDGTADPQPVITYEHASLCIVEYVPGTRVRRRALRRWQENGRWYATLYEPDFIYKFQASQPGENVPEAVGWQQRVVRGEDWPLRNPFGVVNVVEFAVNRSLRPAPFGTATGEFEPHLRHIDRINYKTFCGLIALTWSGMPLRALIGDPILYEEDGKTPIKPFDALSSDVIQIENPDGKLMQLPEANIENFSPEMDIKHLAALTKTPAHYLLGELVNLSADAIRAAEAALLSKIRSHHRLLGESHEEVMRLAFRVLNPDDPRGQDQSAQVIWKDPESRSLAERADAAVKLAQILPWQAIAQYVLGASPQEIDRWQASRGADAMMSLLQAPAVPAAPGAQAPSLVPALNGGNGAIGR